MDTTRFLSPRVAPGVILAISAVFAAACGDRATPTSPMPTTAALGKGFTPSGPNSLPLRGRIAFSSNVTGDQEIYTMNEDGGDIVRLTYSPGQDDAPVWSSDGKKISFVRTSATAAEVFVVNADGSGVKQLTFLGLPNIGGIAWSPDSRRIVFAAGSSPFYDDYDLYVMNANGGGLAKLTSDVGSEVHPSWSPDGTRLAFASTRTSQYNIFVMKPDGSNQTQFSYCVVGCDFPEWSPDGTRIAISNMNGWAIDVAPVSDWYLKTTLVTGAVFPKWSPDGVKLVFVSQASTEIETINADGSGQKQLTSMSSVELYPSWGRKQ